jgi:hypothetical protein
MRKKFLLFMTAVLYSSAIFAQQDAGLNLDHSTSRTMGEFFTALRARTHYGLGIAYQKASFFNPMFYDNVDNASIKNNGGFEVSFFLNLSPVMIDASYFNSAFEVGSQEYALAYMTSKAELQGCDVYLSYAPLLPDWGIVSEILMPFVGVGYQSSSLRARTKEEEAKTTGSYGTSSPMWKGGLKLNLGSFFIKGEYKQSLTLSKPQALSMFSIGAGFMY